MKKPAPGDDGPPLPPRPRPGHRYLIASIVMPFLGLALAIGYLSTTPSFGGLDHWPTTSREDHKPRRGRAGCWGLPGGRACSAVKSITGKEEPGYLAALGLLLNLPFVLLWLMMMGERLIEWFGVK